MINKSLIKEIKSRRVFDSRGNPTVEVEIFTENGSSGRAISPSGASTGLNEAIEVRDNDKMFKGKDVKRGLKIIDEIIAPKLIGLSCEDQENIDRVLLDLDKSNQKINIGGNVTTAISIANYLCSNDLYKETAFKYHSFTNDYKIPKPEIQIFGGGAHAGNKKSFQDFLIFPLENYTCEEYFNIVYNVSNSAKKKLVKGNNFFGYCDEGGLFPHNLDHFQICEIINEALIENSLNPGKEIAISIDVAASNFYNNKIYQLYDMELDKFELTNIFEILINEYNVKIIEDPYEEKDISSFSTFKKKFGSKVDIIGDDLICTDYNLLNTAINQDAVNGIIIKINQCGTITETLQTLKLAKEKKIKTILSARSGDTEENFLSHLAVAWATDMIKVGSFSRSERTSKWNELIRIEEEINKNDG